MVPETETRLRPALSARAMEVPPVPAAGIPAAAAAVTVAEFVPVGSALTSTSASTWPTSTRSARIESLVRAASLTSASVPETVGTGRPPDSSHSRAGVESPAESLEDYEAVRTAAREGRIEVAPDAAR